jgi:hypothetical protein
MILDERSAMRLRALAFFALVFAVSCPFSRLSAQSVISTRAGLINYSEGLVFLDSQPISRKFGNFERMKNGSTLVTESGRAEVLLTPNTFLRIGEKSSIRMISDSLSDPRVEVLAGSAMLDSESAAKDGFVTLLFKDSAIRFIKPGRYRIDADPPQLRVFEGQAEVSKNGARDGTPTTIESSQLMPLDGAPVVKRFTEGADGLLDIWSDERHSLIASNLLDSQSITDPLLDSGQNGSGDYLSSLGAYGGYIPMAGLPSMLGGYYGYNTLGFGGLGYYGGYSAYALNPYGYNPYIYSAVRPYGGVIRPAFPQGISVYGVRPPSASIFAPRPASGTVNIPRPVFAPRPVGTSAVHVGGHIGGHR